MFFNNNFILASTSKSRKKIFKNINIPIKTIRPNCDEGILRKQLLKKQYTPKKISLELARLKSKSISLTNKKHLVVGSDTVIEFEGKIINKAKNTNEARAKIKKLSNKKHIIYSSASVFYNNKEVWNATQKSTIKIRRLIEGDIDAYLKKTEKKILSSAGCYQAESLGPNIIENIEGDFFNVLGFPLFPFLLFLNTHTKIK